MLSIYKLYIFCYMHNLFPIFSIFIVNDYNFTEREVLLMKKKHFKKLVSVALAAVMAIGMSTTTFAAAPQPDKTEKTISANGYDFVVTEKIYPDYSVSRTYTRNPMTRATASEDETVAMLIALGMSEDDVNAIPANTLLDFANGKEITITTSYTKHNENSNTTVGLQEDVALSSAEILSQQQEKYILENPQEITPYGEKPNNSKVPGVFEDSYMKMTHAAINQGNGAYKFTVNATWLTMPFFRGYDSIGSCAMNGTVTPNTSYGKYWYNTKTFNMGNVSTVPSGDITITDKTNAVNGNWYGSAGVFNLPNDPGGSGGLSVMHTDLKAYYEYKGHVSQPNIESYFNTVGTYVHATITITGSPSVSIDTSGTVSASIGISVAGGEDIRNAELEVRYKP